MSYLAMKLRDLITILLSLLANPTYSEELIRGKVLENFEDTSAWHLVNRVSLSGKDARNFESSAKMGGNILINSDTRVKGLPYLLTKESYRDVDVCLEFMIPKGSNAGVYLMGRYEVQILDSYGKRDVKFSDIGGIYEEWEKGGIDVGARSLFVGQAPLVNAAKAPGEWQRLDIRFCAPRFDSDGRKLKDAHFLSVHLNGKLVQKDVFVPGPSVSNPVKGEASSGPLAIQGDHGPIAIRSFLVKPLLSADSKYHF